MKSTKVFAISDLHVDYPENLRFILSWSKEKYGNHALIVAGDVTDNIALLKSTLETLVNTFKHVFFVPGKIFLYTLCFDNNGEVRGKMVTIHAVIIKI